MTEFEISGLSLKKSSLEVQSHTLWVAVAQVTATVVVSFSQIAVVWAGIRAMQRSCALRAHEQRQRRAEAMCRPDQQCFALDALIKRTAPGK